MGTRLLNKIPMKKFQYRKRSDEGINLLQACYENPLFEEDGEVGEPVSSVRNGTRETIAKGNGSTGNYRFDPTVAQDTIVDFKESSKWKRRALYIITGGIVIIATLGILTGIIVSKEERNKKMESTQKVTEKVLFNTRRIDGTLKIVQGPFSEFSSDLQDTHTVAYSLFSSAFIYQMNSIFNASEFSKVYYSTEIVNISSGSVVVNFIIHLHTDVNIVSSTEVHLVKLILDGMSSGPRFFILDCKSVKITIIDTHTPVIASPLATGQCAPIELRPCINMTDYTSTAFPNVLGHTNAQQVTDVVTSKHMDLFTNICYGYSNDFWCSVFNPECKDGNPVPPCREYCEDVYSGCGDHFRRQFGAILNCSSLPEAKRNNICRSNPYKPGKCLPMSEGLCTDVGYTKISYPNYAAQISEHESLQYVQLIAGIQHATHCYQHSLLLACAAFMPKCSGTEQIPTHAIPPCRSLCEGFTERCAIFLDIFFSPWPSQINCHVFPDVDDPSVCIGYTEAHEPAIPSPCSSGELVCDNSTCIPLSWRCDDYQDCADNKDEVPMPFRPGFSDATCAVCAPGTIRCSPLSTLCIEKNKRCNGFEDCPLGIDERECVQLGFGSRQGTLSVYDGHTEQWSKVCFGGWNSSWSQLVCTQLGFKTTGSITYEVDTTSGVRLKLGQMKTNAKDHLIQSYFLPSSSCDGDKVVKIICDDPVCGTRPAYFQPMVRIVGGDTAEPGAWPWLVSLHGGLDQRFFCGGSVISEYWVLTAGHCVGGRTDPSGLTLIVGQPRRLAYSKYTQIHEASRIILFPEYDSVTVNNDIALIQLKEPINFNDHVRPVCLPKRNWKTPLGTRCTAAGWGKASEQALDYERAIKQVDLEVVDTDECREAIMGAERKVPYQVNQNVICAGGGLHNDACSGDSGGPLLCRVNQTSDVWFIGGIVSWGVGCAYPNVPGVYTDVPKYINWIEKTTNLTFF